MMKKILSLMAALFAITIIGCTGAENQKSNEDFDTITDNITEIYIALPSEKQETKAQGSERKKLDIKREVIAGHNMISATAEAGSLDYTNEKFPSMIVRPITPIKEKSLVDSPVLQKRAAWNAALTALKACLPYPDDLIIFDWSKTEMQINNANECLFSGDIEAKNDKGEYVEYYMNIHTTYVKGDPSDPSSWKAKVILSE